MQKIHRIILKRELFSPSRRNLIADSPVPVFMFLLTLLVVYAEHIVGLLELVPAVNYW